MLFLAILVAVAVLLAIFVYLFFLRFINPSKAKSHPIFKYFSDNIFAHIFVIFFLVLIETILTITYISPIIVKNKSTLFSSVHDGNSNPAITHEKLLDISNTLNSQCPKIVDSITRFDNSFVVGNSLFYKFTILVLPSNQISVETLRKNAHLTIKTLCESPEMKPIFESGDTVVYQYFGNDGKHVYDLNIPPNSCSE